MGLFRSHQSVSLQFPIVQKPGIEIENLKVKRNLAGPDISYRNFRNLTCE